VLSAGIEHAGAPLFSLNVLEHSVTLW